MRDMNIWIVLKRLNKMNLLLFAQLNSVTE